MSALPNLTRVLINLTRGNAKIWGNVNLPSAGSGGRIAFGPVAKTLLAKRGSVAQPGDTVLDLGDRYVLGYFSESANDQLYRMFRTPYSADVMRASAGHDPVTGFDKGSKAVKVGFAWFDVQTSGMAADVDSLKRTKYRILTGYPLQVNDVINGMKITSVSDELGIKIAEAE
jgi:hypothetical protein